MRPPNDLKRCGHPVRRCGCILTPCMPSWSPGRERGWVGGTMQVVGSHVEGSQLRAPTLSCHRGRPPRVKAGSVCVQDGCPICVARSVQTGGVTQAGQLHP